MSNVYVGKKRILLPILLLAAFVNVIYIGWIVAEQENGLKGFTIIAVGAVVFLLFEFLFITQQLDIAIDDQGIYKMMFGRKWRSILWGNVREIQTGLVSRFSKAPIRAYWIYSEASHTGSTSRVISFNEERENFNALLNQVTAHIASQNCRPKFIRDGKETSPTQFVICQ